MDQPVIDFTAIKSTSDLPDALTNFPATIVHSQPGLSQAREWKIDLRWRIDEGPFEGTMVFDNISFAPGALSMTKQKLIGIGLPADFTGTPNEIAAELLGSSAIIAVSKDKDKGKKDDNGEPYRLQHRVRSTRPIGSTDYGASFDDNSDVYEEPATSSKKR